MSQTSKCLSNLIKYFLLILSIFLVITVEENEILEQSNARIIAGINANKTVWKFIASIATGRVHICGATLIRPRWVLTAAHCVRDNTIDTQVKHFGDLVVRLGPDDLYFDDPKNHLLDPNDDIELIKDLVSVIPKENIFEIDRIIIHPNFHHVKSPITSTKYRSMVGNDIALLKLSSKPLNYTLVKLPKKPINMRISCKTAGWGVPNLDDKIPADKQNLLQELDIHIFSNDDCISILAESIKHLPVSRTEAYYLIHYKFCSYSNKNEQGVLLGDLGGPMICDNEIQGVICQFIAKENKSRFWITSIYTDITYYIDWIDEVFQSYGEPKIPSDVYRSCNRRNAHYGRIDIFLLIICMLVIKI